MKAIIIQTLVRPTRFGRSVIKHSIIAKGSQIINLVNFYIHTRANKTKFIKVSKFDVRIYDYKSKLVNSWTYKPTYNDEFDD